MLNKDSQSDMGKNCFQDNRCVAEGSIGGGLISALILCKTMTIFFSGSDSEISYGSYIRMILLDFAPELRKLKKETFEGALQVLCDQIWALSRTPRPPCDQE